MAEWRFVLGISSSRWYARCEVLLELGILVDERCDLDDRDYSSIWDGRRLQQQVKCRVIAWIEQKRQHWSCGPRRFRSRGLNYNGAEVHSSIGVEVHDDARIERKLHSWGLSAKAALESRSKFKIELRTTTPSDHGLREALRQRVSGACSIIII